jgi:hypothetical protein
MVGVLRVSIVVLLLASPALAQAADFSCKVEVKLSRERVYSESELQKGQFLVLIEDRGDSAFLSRCSFTLSSQEVTCDRYEVDKVVLDEYVRIKKFYVFRSQFDVQVYPDLSFIENNGRGGIAFGTCSVVAP